MTMKIAKWTVDKQEGMGGTSGHFTIFSAGFCVWKKSSVSCIVTRFISRSTRDHTLRSKPENYVEPGAPRPFWPCADVPWCRWSAAWSHMFPYCLHCPGVGLSRSVSGTRKRNFCSDKEKMHFTGWRATNVHKTFIPQRAPQRTG